MCHKLTTYSRWHDSSPGY